MKTDPELKLWFTLVGYAQYLNKRLSFHATTDGHISKQGILIPLEEGDAYCHFQWDDNVQRCRIEPLDQSGNGELLCQNDRLRYLRMAIAKLKCGVAMLDTTPAKRASVPWYKYCCGECKVPLQYHGRRWNGRAFELICPIVEEQAIQPTVRRHRAQVPISASAV